MGWDIRTKQIKTPILRCNQASLEKFPETNSTHVKESSQRTKFVTIYKYPNLRRGSLFLFTRVVPFTELRRNVR